MATKKTRTDKKQEQERKKVRETNVNIWLTLLVKCQRWSGSPVFNTRIEKIGKNCQRHLSFTAQPQRIFANCFLPVHQYCENFCTTNYFFKIFNPNGARMLYNVQQEGKTNDFVQGDKT